MQHCVYIVLIRKSFISKNRYSYNHIKCRLLDVAEGDVIMISTQRFIYRYDSYKNTKQFKAYDAIETLLYGEANKASTLRQVPDDGTTYGLIYQKGMFYYRV